MAFGEFDRHDSETMAEINITPLVDVMLVLLIVFMVTMPVLTHSIPLNLPTASEEQPIAETKEPIRISVDKSGAYFLKEAETSQDELRVFLAEAAKDNDDAILAISADKEVPYEYVADLLGMAQESGLSKIGFVTEAEATPQ
ncbi:MAG: biopolymer transporter ExbD [Neisseriaceae bacterium]|nr:biopolymer transporter ExbD [Neisseriaceae bacterium]MBP6861945.1 biopolymer transporter ExbD [Neisseriaceae bacterium]